MDGRASGHGRIYQASGDQHIVEHHHHAPSWSGPDTVRSPALGRTPLVLRDRVELMDTLRASVAPGAGGMVHVLHGLGGCGKTAVACALFEHATADGGGGGGRIGLWVNASDTTSLRSGMLAVAADRGAAEGELMAARSGLRAAADLVWDHLDRSDRPWLLVIDNADDPAVLRDGGWLRSSPRGAVLVTSRQASSRWWPGAELLQVGVLPRADAAQVLRDLAPGAGTAEEAEEIADRLGRLPLALTLAGTFLAHQVISPWTLTEYGQRLDIDLIDQGAVGTAGDARHLVSSTWELSLDAVADQGLPEAQTLLRLLACWASDPLPLSVLAGLDLGADLPAGRVEPALRGLLDHSLTELVPGPPRSLRTHGVLLDSVARSTPAEQRGNLAAKAAQLLLAVLPETPERGIEAAPFRPLAPHVLALLRRVSERQDVDRSVVESAAECALRLAVNLHRSGDSASALAVGVRAVDLAKAGLGDDHPLVVRLRQRVARTLRRLGRFAEAETLARRTLADCERLFGPTGLDTLESCAVLALVLWTDGREAEGAALMQRSLEGWTEVLGPLHPVTLRARYIILELLRGPDLDRAIEGAPALIRECADTTGPDHTITMMAQLNYANALFYAGRPAAALPPARQAFAAAERRYGSDYQITLASRSLLALTLAGVGEFPEAIELMEVVVEKRTRILGPDHGWTRNSVDNLADLRASIAPTR
ncbi:tetratricopeptide repeat protein [Streptomyces sp. ISL-44]|uniref:tetratricopeptide repeat protein n=1 Tax=Streptomyces sp. ISL-44 TaxID=2819184 RepID=UPI002035B77E|nr:tetratricopeptide repeat protein [Streptomyces sp. ISL-44]